MCQGTSLFGCHFGVGPTNILLLSGFSFLGRAIMLIGADNLNNYMHPTMTTVLTTTTLTTTTINNYYFKSNGLYLDRNTFIQPTTTMTMTTLTMKTTTIHY